MLLNISKIIFRLYILSIPLVLFYVISKEREEFGCNGLTIKKQCNETESVYLKGTKFNPTDTKKILYKKLKKLISFNDNVTFWRKSYIMSTIICIVIQNFIPDTKDHNLITLHITIFAILYFYLNFMFYHIHMPANIIGFELVDKLSNM
jgi:hypothetical protein